MSSWRITANEPTGFSVNVDTPQGVVNLSTPKAPDSGERIHRVIKRCVDDNNWRVYLCEDVGSGLPIEPIGMRTIGTVRIISGQTSVTDNDIANISD